jgi:hypothetical protein
MTNEQMNYPRQFTSIIEENTNFYSHTGDGGNKCFASNCDTIEKVWLESGYATMDDYSNENATHVNVTVPNNNSILDMDLERLSAAAKSGDVDYILEFSKPLIEIKCTTIEEIIEAFKTIEKQILVK